jgi:serine/threonine protein kinase
MPTSPNASFVTKITNRADQILARFALRREFVTREQIDHCLKLQEDLQSQGEVCPLGHVLHKSGLLTERQVKALEVVTKKALDQLTTRKRSPTKAKAAAPGATTHLSNEFVNRIRQEMIPQELKQYLLDTFLECALKSRPLKANEPTPEPFGPYKDLTLIGQGGMANVYKVYDAEMQMELALKVMRPELSCDREYILRFLREVSNTALIEHVNVVRFYSFGAVAGRLYFTLELIEGQTLKQRMNEGRIPSRKSLEILRQVMEGLIAAHEQGIGHRDLKPANLMLTTNVSQFGFDLQGESNTVVKITDFGLARMYGGEVSGTITQDGQFLGTAKYVAPELIKGEDPTLQSDIFSLGVMAFQMFSGIPPFQVKKKVDYIEANLRWQAPLLHEVAMEIAPGIGVLVEAMLEKDPMERPTADSLLRDIHRLENMGAADDPGAVEDITSVFHPSRKLIKERRKNKRGAKTDPRIYIALGIAGFLLFCLFLFLIFQKRSNKSSPADIPAKKQERIDQPPIKNTKLEIISKLKGFPDIIQPPLSSFRGQMEKLKEFSKWVKKGDEAYRKNKLDQAIRAWEKAKAYVSLAALNERLEQARSADVLKDIKSGVKTKNWRKVVDLCNSAINNDSGTLEISEIRARAKVIVQKQIKLRVAVRKIRDAESQGRLKEALRIVDEAERNLLLPDPEQIDPTGTLKQLKERLRARLKQAGDEEKALLAIKRARIFLLDQSWDLSEQTLKRARQLDSLQPQIAKLERYINAGRRTPKGYVFMPPATVEVFGERKTINAMYVSREPISNKLFLVYLNGPGRGRRRPKSWKGGQYPEDKESQAVLSVNEDQATLYAKSLKGRLPKRAERIRLDRFLKLGKHRVNRVNSKKELDDGFRIIIPLNDLP